MDFNDSLCCVRLKKLLEMKEFFEEELLPLVKGEENADICTGYDLVMESLTLIIKEEAGILSDS